MLERRLPGPAWSKGIIFATVENVILYPITLFEDIHPAIRTGQVDRYFTWPAFWQSVPRHIAYGAVLGVLSRTPCSGRVELVTPGYVAPRQRHPSRPGSSTDPPLLGTEAS